MLSWSMPSSSGRNKMKCRFLKHLPSSSGQDLVLVSLNISGEFWDRTKEISDAALLDDYSIELSQVVLCRSSLDSLVNKLSSWIESPIEIFEELTVDSDPLLRVHIGKTDELICTKEKPAFVFEYQGGGLKNTRISYLVDRTCLEASLNELKNSLLNLKRAS